MIWSSQFSLLCNVTASPSLSLSLSLFVLPQSTSFLLDMILNHVRAWCVLRSVVSNSGNPQFDSQDVDGASLLGCLSSWLPQAWQVNAEKGLHTQKNATLLFWSNADHSAKAGQLLETTNPFLKPTESTI
jgi:hypothetical protein